MPHNIAVQIKSSTFAADFEEYIIILIFNANNCIILYLVVLLLKNAIK